MNKLSAFLARNHLLLVFLIFVVSAFLRLYSLSTIHEQIFDEVYFPVFAQNYLTKTDFFDAHPPLGKLIIAGGIALFGNQPLGWRIMNVIAGLLLLGVVYGFTRDLTKNKQTALIALFLIAIEPMALVESRVGLINIYLALFSLAGLWFFWRWWTLPKNPVSQLALALLFFSLATAVKWVGIGALASALVFVIIIKFVTPHKKISFTWKHGLTLLILPLAYLLTFIPDVLRGQDIKWWHESAFGYHASLTATHPYGSSWWSWALMLRPIWLYYKAVESGMIAGIIEVGNVITWIGGLVALFFTISTLKTTPLFHRERNLYLVLTYLALYLPWIVISRVKFIYHYFVPVLILLILLGIVVDEKLLSRKEYAWIGITFLLVAAGFFIYFLPLLMGIPVAEAFYRHHMWLKSWI